MSDLDVLFEDQQVTQCHPTGADTTVPAASTEPAVVVLIARDGAHDPSLVDLVSGAGFTLRRRSPDEKTLRELRIAPAALVLADVPPADGAFLRWIRRIARELGSNAPSVVVIADEPSEDELQQAFAAGARDVLAKPVLPSLLRVKLRQYVKPPTTRPRCVGPYAIKRVLGRGGMGTVYLAERDGREVALKVIEASVLEARPELLVRFRRETAALRVLRSAGIPRLVDTGRAENTFYCAMEYVPGPTLLELLREGPLADGRVERILVELAQTLQHVHDAGLVHRDVKPANVIVPPGRNLCLVDFGLAKELGDFGLTRADEIVGTAAYLAPERVLGQAADGRADAYSLGITALEAAIGGAAVQGSPFKVLSELARGRVPNPRALMPGRCPVLVSVLERLLAKEPAKRMSLSEVVRRLSGCCAPVVLRSLVPTPRAA